jgi:hypothetical protein
MGRLFFSYSRFLFIPRRPFARVPFAPGLVTLDEVTVAKTERVAKKNSAGAMFLDGYAQIKSAREGDGDWDLILFEAADYAVQLHRFAFDRIANHRARFAAQTMTASTVPSSFDFARS